MDKDKDFSRIFSIDIESYIRKTAEFSQRSAMLYPVELVREAFGRGAESVNVIIDGRKVEIEDNGNPLGLEELKMLSSLRDPGEEVEVKERAVSLLRGEHGPGLIGVFAPHPKKITVETASPGSCRRLTITGEEVFYDELCSINKGTKITVFRNGKDQKKETTAFREFCRWAERSIVLNGEMLISGKNIPGAMVSSTIQAEGGGFKEVYGIPADGNICRIWLTAQGIVHGKKDIPPFKGFVFSAVVESPEIREEDILSRIIPRVKNLYHYLIMNYHELKGEHKERLEELVYLHTKETGNEEFSGRLKPFRVYGKKDTMGLDELRRLSAAGKLYIRNIHSPESGSMGSGDVFAVELSPRQIDFVVNHLRIPVKFIESTGIYTRSLKERILHKIQVIGYHLFPLINFFSDRMIAEDDLWKEERDLLEKLRASFPCGEETAGKGFQTVGFHMTKGFALSPLSLNADRPGITEKKLEVKLHRGNRMIRKIVKLNSADPRNFDIAVSFVCSELKALLKKDG